MKTVNIFWFRRDLRLTDNHGLFQALRSGQPVVPIFIFDKNILDKLADNHDRRVAFIHAAIEEMQAQLTAMGSSLEVYYGFPDEVFKDLFSKYRVEKIFANHDYEPYAIERDAEISTMANSDAALFETFKDQVIFEKKEVVKDDGNPYTVFTPYSRKWKAAMETSTFDPFPVERYFSNFYRQDPVAIPSLKQMGFKSDSVAFPSKELDEQLVLQYKERRNFPAESGTSRLGVHLRFGTVSIRDMARRSAQLSETFLNELIWRDFYHMILWNFSQVGRGEAFKPAYDKIEWRKDTGEFEKWCSGQTGYPIVDAGMRELNATGFMHNRVRMIVASFLAKHLLLDWRLGEAYFAEKLLDFDLAANNGGWQWAAGSGCDAAPYFRIFNPYLQTKKFDPGLEYINKWVPELNELHYPKPIVDHDFARKRCLEVYQAALKNN